jgi:hypothetical protein
MADIIASITACSIGRAVIHVLMYTKTFKTDIIVFIYMGLGLWCLMQLSKYFSYIMAVSFIGAGNRNTWRKPLTSQTNFIT